MTRLGLVAAALALGLTMATAPSFVPMMSDQAVAQPMGQQRAEARAAERRARIERQRAARRALAEKRRACRAEARATKGVVARARAYTRCMRKS